MSAPLRRNRYDVAVVGAGCAGMTAAWHAAMRGMSVLLAECEVQPGGQVATVGRVEGMPGVASSGPDFSVELLAQARKAGARLLTAGITAIEQAHDGFTLRHEGGFGLARAVVVATGGRARALGVPGETELQGRGVGHCAACDGPLCRGRDVVVVGGGDGALQEAILLSGYARTVTVLVRGRPRARRHYLGQAETCANLRFVWNATVTRIGGKDGVEAVVFRHADGREEELACYAIFPKIGWQPRSGIVATMADLAAGGEIVTDARFETRTPGLFAIGSVRSGYGGDLIDAAAEGAAAARIVAARAASRTCSQPGGDILP